MAENPISSLTLIPHNDGVVAATLDKTHSLGEWSRARRIDELPLQRGSVSSIVENSPRLERILTLLWGSGWWVTVKGL